jgi:tetratricopeptide (TPR) repeat protein
VLPIAEADAYQRVKWAAERAVALDDESADAHAAYAIVRWWQRDWRGAEQALLRAVELNPGHTTANTWYSVLLSGMGRSEEAVRVNRRAVSVDPFNVVANANLGWLCQIVRDTECAATHLQRALEIAPYPNALRQMAKIYVDAGKLAAADSAIREAIRLAPQRTDFIADLAWVQAKSGRRADAYQTIARAKHDPWEPFTVGRAYAALGERDSAFVWLDRANWKWPHRALLADPALDNLRRDSRFARLQERVEWEMGLR